MRLKKIVAAVSAAVLGATLLPTLAAPAQADQASARAEFRQMALDALARVETLRAKTGCYVNQPIGESKPNCSWEGDRAWTYAYQADLTAFKYGSWTHSQVQSLLQNVYAEKLWQHATIDTEIVVGATAPAGYKPYGYGKNYARSGHTATTPVAVTMTDHVGEPLLEGYQAGGVARSEIQFIADSLWALGTQGTLSGNGQCVPTVPGDLDGVQEQSESENFCIINQSAGVAAYMQKLIDLPNPIVPTGETVSSVQSRIASLTNFIEFAYQKASTVTHPSGYEVGEWAPGYWPYAYDIGRKADGTLKKDWIRAPQDPNHNAYTIEAALTLGLPSGADAVVKQNNRLDYLMQRRWYNASTTGSRFYYDNSNTERTYTAMVDDNTAQVRGRFRAMHLSPATNPRNMLAEARWYFAQLSNTAGDKYTLLENVQGGRYASWLAASAQGGTEQYAAVGRFDVPKIYAASDTTYSNPLSTVYAGQRYAIVAHPRTAGNDFITNIPTRLIRAGSFIEGKPTGLETRGVVYTWDAAGVTAGDNTRCIRVEVTADQPSAFSSECNWVDID